MDGPIHQELVVVVEEYVVLVLVNDIHGTEDVECVVYAPLDVLKVDSLAFIAKLSVHFQDFVGNLRPRDHGPLLHFE